MSTPAPTWILLRGLAREQAHWGAFPQALQAALRDVDGGALTRVCLLDLPGAGERWQERASASVAGLVAAVRAQARQRCGPPPWTLVGLSLGGMVAAHWALAHPEEVAALAVVNTSMRPLCRVTERLRPANWPRLLALAWQRDPRAVEATVLALTSARPDAQAGVLEAWCAIRAARPVATANALRQLLAAARFRLGPQRPRMPALVLGATGDMLVSPACTAALARHWQLPRVQHPWAGHDLPLDDPAWLVERLADPAWRERPAA